MSRTRARTPPATCSSASRIARSRPSRSSSLIVKTTAPRSRSSVRSASSSDRTPTSATRAGSTAGSVHASWLERASAQTERCRQHHAVDVAREARLRRVEIAVRVDPQDAAWLVAAKARQRPERDRVVTAQHERQAAVVLGTRASLATSTHVAMIWSRKRSSSSPSAIASATGVCTLPQSRHSRPSSAIRRSSPA